MESHICIDDGAVRRVPLHALDAAVDTLVAPALELTTVAAKSKLLRELRGETDGSELDDSGDDEGAEDASIQ